MVIYFVQTLWFSLVQPRCISKSNLNTCADMHIDPNKCKVMFCHRVQGIYGCNNIIINNIWFSVQNILPVMLWLDEQLKADVLSQVYTWTLRFWSSYNLKYYKYLCAYVDIQGNQTIVMTIIITLTVVVVIVFVCFFFVVVDNDNDDDVICCCHCCCGIWWQ